MLALNNPILDGLPPWAGITLRAVNIILAIWTGVFAAVSLRHTPDRYQRARFGGLSMLALVFAWSTLFRLGQPVTIQVPFFTVALAVSAYGSLGFLRRPLR